MVMVSLNRAPGVDHGSQAQVRIEILLRLFRFQFLGVSVAFNRQFELCVIPRSIVSAPHTDQGRPTRDPDAAQANLFLV